MQNNKRLEEMTLEELWQLFPISLMSHNPEWSRWAGEEIALLETVLTELHPTVTHIGSTAIEGICAKPIVDILVEIPIPENRDIIKERMLANGYILMAESQQRMSFNKGYTPEGYAKRVFHIHFHNPGDNAEIAFRDYLRSHREVAAEYERLKQSLLPAFRHDRDGYTEAKTDFIRHIVSLS